MSDIIYIDGHRIDLDYQVPLITSMFVKYRYNGKAQLVIRGTMRDAEKKLGYLSVASCNALKQIEQQMVNDTDDITVRKLDAFDAGVVKLFFTVKFEGGHKSRYIGVIPRTAYNNLINAVMDHDCGR